MSMNWLRNFIYNEGRLQSFWKLTSDVKCPVFNEPLQWQQNITSSCFIFGWKKKVTQNMGGSSKKEECETIIILLTGQKLLVAHGYVDKATNEVQEPVLTLPVFSLSNNKNSEMSPNARWWTSRTNFSKVCSVLFVKERLQLWTDISLLWKKPMHCVSPS